MARRDQIRKTHPQSKPAPEEPDAKGSGWVTVFILAASLGGIAGVLSVPDAATRLQALNGPGLLAPTRARLPKAGDYWQGCDEARAAGTAPIYANEPGYREDMDGDHDGIACEPHS